MSRAVCDLESRSRWAVTGTPIQVRRFPVFIRVYFNVHMVTSAAYLLTLIILFQNHMDDLATLFKFIRAYPYHEVKQFKTDISYPWKSGDGDNVINRLKHLSASLILRRPVTTIALPPRRDLHIPVVFSNEERHAYEVIRNKAIISIDQALHPGTNPSSSDTYINILQQIESMRLICNLGMFYESRHRDILLGLQQGWAALAQQVFNAQRQIGTIICMQCSSNIGLSETLFDTIDGKREGQYFRCLKFCCGECMERLFESKTEIRCGHIPHCPTGTVSLVGQATEDVPSLGMPPEPQTGLELPSKIKALIKDIKRHPPHVKW